jgi:hypothetical protein
MFKRVSVLVPTRARSGYLRQMLESYKATLVDSETSEIIFRCDDDDPDSAAMVRQLGYRCVVGPRRLGYRSLPTFYNEMLEEATGDLFLCGNDDMVFRTRGWASGVLELANQYPDGIFNIGVTTGLNDDKFPFSIVSRRLTELMGLINEPRLLFSDIFLLDVARAFDRSIRISTVEIGHDWAGHSDDQTRREANEHEFSMVFADTAGNWTQSYRDLHDGVIAETVARIRGKLRREGSRLGRASPAGGEWTSATCEGLRKQLIEKAGIKPTSILLLSSGRSPIGRELGAAFDRLIEVQPPTERDLILESTHHAIAYGDTTSTRFLYRLLRRYKDIGAVILDEDRYSRMISPYYLVRRAMSRPGVMVIVGPSHKASRDRRTNGASDSDPVTEFVNGLTSGELDGIEHEIYTLSGHDGQRLHYEIIT